MASYRQKVVLINYFEMVFLEILPSANMAHQPNNHQVKPVESA